jgi:transposase InsO family protein
MAEAEHTHRSRQPTFKLEGNIAENWRNFEMRFNDFAISCGFRDLAKSPDVAADHDDHWKVDKRQLEISNLRLCLPDESLALLRYTITPQIAEGDRTKPWRWLEKLRNHYTGSSSSTLTDRYNFSALIQAGTDTVQTWETKVRQAGALCEYGERADELLRDKFIFGLSEKNKDIRTELLKSDKNQDGSTKTLHDVVQLARAFETAFTANSMISKSQHAEQVHYTAATNSRSNPRRLPHAQLTLKREQGACWYCGIRPSHPWSSCRAKNKMCSKCGFMDHFATVCLMDTSYPAAPPNKAERPSSNRKPNTDQRRPVQSRPQPKQVNQLGTSQVSSTPTDWGISDYYDDEEYDQVFALSNHTSRQFWTSLPISSTGSNFTHVKFQIDTAATCNTIPIGLLNELNPQPKLLHSPHVLHPYGDSPPIHPLGQVDLLCEKDDRYVLLRFQVLPDNIMKSKPSLLCGLDSEKLGLIALDSNVYSMTHVNPTSSLTKDQVLTRFASQFEGKGYLGPPVHFTLNDDVTPIQMPVHRVPLSKRHNEYETIQRYVRDGILAKVTDPTPWCSNELIRERKPANGKPGKFRICIDPSQTINKAIKRPIYQMPTLTENLHKLTNAKCFSIVDVLDGFLNVPLDHASSLATTMHTSFGRYRWLRLPFGVSSAPEEFQQRLSTALEGLRGIANIADDILLYGEGETYAAAEADHDANFLALMDRCKEKNIKLNPGKLQFKLKQVKFMGEIITDKGIQPDPEKVRAIIDMPRPVNKAGLLRFLGMLNYQSPYCPNLSSVLKPLRLLTREDTKFLWSPTQEDAFQRSKQLIAHAATMRYYDMNKPVVLQVDASENGLGGALLQPNDDGKLQAVAYTSCSLTDAETKYAQIEKECLAICHAFQRWDHWLYGKSDITVHTDHQPLEAILNKPLNRAPIRLQRMVMRLQRYSFQTKYQKGSSLLIADTLSRAYLDCPTAAKATGFDIFRLDIEEPEPNERLTPETTQTLQRETLTDPQLSKLAEAITNGWPDSKGELDAALKPYWSYRDELAVYNSIIYKGHQCIVPSSLRMSMLKKIHASHLGAESNIRLARQVLFWPGMRSAIEDMCQACSQCAQFGSSAPTEPMKSLPIPERPWDLVSQDICSYKGKDYLVTVCHFTDFIEVDLLENLLSATVVSKTEVHFARYGVPTTCHTDNGPQFISAEYEAFSNLYGFNHTTSSPYHSRGNGKAEAAVRVVKSLLSKSDNIQLALLNLRNTPPQGHTYSPAQRMFSRRTRTTLPTLPTLLRGEMIDPQIVQQDIRQRRIVSKQSYDKHSGPDLPPLHVGTHVYTKPPPTKHGQPWAYGQIVDNPRARSYVVRTPTGMVRRNRVHLRQASAPPPPLGNVKTVPIHISGNVIPIVTTDGTALPKNANPSSPTLPKPMANPPPTKCLPKTPKGQPLTTMSQNPGSPVVVTKSGRQVKKPCRLDM